VLGADTRSTSGSTVADKNCEKIHFIAPNIYCCGAGTAADTENTTGTPQSPGPHPLCLTTTLKKTFPSEALACSVPNFRVQSRCAVAYPWDSENKFGALSQRMCV